MGDTGLRAQGPGLKAQAGALPEARSPEPEAFTLREAQGSGKSSDTVMRSPTGGRGGVGAGGG